MRIGFDAKRAFFNNTGLGNYSRDTIRILSKHYPNNDYFLYTPELKENHRVNRLLKYKNINTRTPSFFNKCLLPIWRNRRIINDLIRDRIDIYHGLSHELPVGIKKNKIKSVVTIHDLIFIRYPDLFTKIDRIIYKNKVVNSCRDSNMIIAASNQTKKDIVHFLKINPDKIKVIYQSCNPVFQSEISHKFRNSIISKYSLPNQFLLFVGTIEKRKNLLTILKAIKLMKNQKLVIIGDGGNYKQECLRFISKNSLANRVIFLKNLEIKEIAAVYQLADMLVYPSLFEGFGIPILEALFSKIPVITSKNSSLIEVGGKNTKYINPLEHIELIDAISEIQKDDLLRKKMITNGMQHAKEFNEYEVAKNLMTLYDGL
tara:strand:+ start:339 stop:1457 length:1119 start_codon:yes stop_codon:yes gene_type:complete